MGWREKTAADESRYDTIISSIRQRHRTTICALQSKPDYLLEQLTVDVVFSTIILREKTWLLQQQLVVRVVDAEGRGELEGN